MKKQKTIVSTFLIAFLICYTLLGLSGTKEPSLTTATEITQNLFAFNSNGEKNDYISARYLKGLDENESFVLTESEKGGYAIFDKESMELIEF